MQGTSITINCNINMTDAQNRMHSNPESMDGCDDMTNLIYLQESDVIWNLECRFRKQTPYTSISEILIAVNPYQRCPIYGESIMNSYCSYINGKTFKWPGPHVYGQAAMALSQLRGTHKNQSILVCGESGAGKTENSKRLMEFLTFLTKTNNTTSNDTGLDKRILDCNPILEAFGNAKTVMNNNSSRFGKYTKILYNESNNIIGAKVETYLLEQSRVVMQESNERNYHSFFLVCKGLQRDQQMELNDIRSFWYLYGNCQGNQSIDVTNKNDLDDFDEICQSFNSININKNQQTQIFEIIGAIIHLGNISFVQTDAIPSAIDDQSKPHVSKCCQLLQINESSLQQRLTTRNIKVGMEIIQTPLNIKDAFINRDAIAKILYSKLFDFIVLQCNRALYNTNSANDNDNMFIGILDIFGFECFENNSFEQLLINYTNEILQQHFNVSIIASEQEEYLREGLPWTQIDVPNNDAIVSLICSKKGLFSNLDAACSMPKGSAAIFQTQLTKQNTSNKHFKEIRKHPTQKNKKFVGFMIKHYAANVIYDCQEFLQKNSDSIHPDTIKMIGQTQSDILKSAFSSEFKKSKKSRSSFRSVGTTFAKQVSSLLKNLKQTRPYFLRCLNPNKRKSSTDWDPNHMSKQLKCNGIVEALRVIKLGYPNRSSYDYILSKFQTCINANECIKKLKSRQQITGILLALDIEKTSYELGFTKVFFKPSTKNYLSIIQNHSGNLDSNQVSLIQRFSKLNQIPTICGVCFVLHIVLIFLIHVHNCIAFFLGIRLT